MPDCSRIDWNVHKGLIEHIVLDWTHMNSGRTKKFELKNSNFILEHSFIGSEIFEDPPTGKH